MNIEIERKFLVLDNSYKTGVQPLTCRQGYISSSPYPTVRIRTMGGKGFITIKGNTTGISRNEYEYEIPFDEARHLLENVCKKPLIEKHRYHVNFEGFIWEVDEFFAENNGLIVAEIELSHEDQPFTKPPWVGAEVSDDIRYYNSRLQANPFSKW